MYGITYLLFVSLLNLLICKKYVLKGACCWKKYLNSKYFNIASCYFVTSSQETIKPLFFNDTLLYVIAFEFDYRSSFYHILQPITGLRRIPFHGRYKTWIDIIFPSATWQNFKPDLICTTCVFFPVDSCCLIKSSNSGDECDNLQ